MADYGAIAWNVGRKYADLDRGQRVPFSTLLGIPAQAPGNQQAEPQTRVNQGTTATAAPNAMLEQLGLPTTAQGASLPREPQAPPSEANVPAWYERGGIGARVRPYTQALTEAARYYGGPHLFNRLQAASDVAQAATPTFGSEGGQEAIDEARSGNYGRSALAGVRGGLEATLDMIPGTKLPLAMAGFGIKAAAPNIMKGLNQMGGIRAYHGSPHDFDRFDMSKIGTGEGAQAYGHGLYFAENEGVAKSYRDTLRGNDRSLETGTKVPEWIANRMEHGDKSDILNLRTDFQKRIAEEEASRATSNQPWLIDGRIAHQRDVLKALDEYEAGTKLKPHGRMYEVDIKADPEHFLDWDKPLRDQPDILGKVTAKYGGEDALLNRAKEFDDLSTRVLENRALQPQWDEMHRDPATRLGTLLTDMRKPPNPYGYDPGAKATGERLYHALGQPSREAATQELLEQGVPGLKYLDQGSRGAGEGSSNYVVFNDQLIDLVRKYGIGSLALLGVGGAAMQSKDADSGRKG